MEKEELNKKIEKLTYLRSEINGLKIKKSNTITHNVVTGIALAIPPLIVGGSLVGYNISRRGIPGNIDYIKKHAYTTVEYSSDTGTTVTTEYKESVSKEDMTDMLYYYGPWEEQKDGTYSYKVTEYELEDVTTEDLYKVFRKEGDISFEDMLGFKIKSVEDIDYKKDSVTQEELQKTPHFEIIVHDEDQKDIVMAKETGEEVSNDIASIAAGSILTLLVDLGLLTHFHNFFYFSSTKQLTSEMKEYEEEYNKIETEINKEKVKK